MLLVGSVLAGFVAFSKKSRKGESNFITGEYRNFLFGRRLTSDHLVYQEGTILTAPLHQSDRFYPSNKLSV